MWMFIMTPLWVTCISSDRVNCQPAIIQSRPESTRLRCRFTAIRFTMPGPQRSARQSLVQNYIPVKTENSGAEEIGLVTHTLVNMSDKYLQDQSFQANLNKYGTETVMCYYFTQLLHMQKPHSRKKSLLGISINWENMKNNMKNRNVICSR